MKKLNNKGFAVSTVLYGIVIMVFLIVVVLISTMATNRSNTKDLVTTTEKDLNNLSYKNYAYKYQFRILGPSGSGLGTANNKIKITQKIKNTEMDPASQTSSNDSVESKVYEGATVNAEYELRYSSSDGSSGSYKYTKEYGKLTSNKDIYFRKCQIFIKNDVGSSLKTTIKVELTPKNGNKVTFTVSSKSDLTFYAEDETSIKVTVTQPANYSVYSVPAASFTVNGSNVDRTYKYIEQYKYYVKVNPADSNVSVTNVASGKVVNGPTCSGGTCTITVNKNTNFNINVTRDYYNSQAENSLIASSNGLSKQVQLTQKPVQTASASRDSNVGLGENGTITVSLPNNSKVVGARITGKFSTSVIGKTLTFYAHTPSDTIIRRDVAERKVGLIYDTADFSYSCSNYQTDITTCPKGNKVDLDLTKPSAVIFNIKSSDPIRIEVQYIVP